MMFCMGQTSVLTCAAYNATDVNSVSILQTNPNFYLILFVPAVQDVPFDLQKKYQKKYFGINVFSIVSMSASQFKAKPDRSARFCLASASPSVTAHCFIF